MDFKSNLKETMKSKASGIQPTYYNLLDAVASGSTEVINSFLKNNAELPSEILQIALECQNFNIEVIKLLIEKGAVLQPDILQIAFQARNGNWEVIQLLLENDAEVSCTCIMKDALRFKDCNIETLRMLLENGAEIPSTFLDLYLVNGYGDCRIIQLLLEEGAELSTRSLSIAVESEYDIDVIKVLLEWGAVIPSDFLGSFKQNCNIEILKLLLEKGAQLTYYYSLHCVLMNHCDIRVIKLLLEWGVNVPSHILESAFKNGNFNVEIMQLLLENGAKMPFEAISNAVKSQCSINVIKLLLERGARFPRKILYYALLQNIDSSEIIKFLLEKGAKIDEADLERVMLCKNFEVKIEIFKLLIEYDVWVSKNNLFQLIKINSANINSCKFLLPYLLIRWIGNNRNYFTNTFQLTMFSSNALYYDMLEFHGCLKNELLKMKNDKIDQNSTLLSFLSQRCSSAYVLCKTQAFLVEEVLSRYHTGKYAYSVDLLYSSLSKFEIINKIYKLDFCALQFENVNSKKVSLNYYIISHIASFLSKTDCFNLMLAFWTNDDKKDLEN